MISQQPSFNWDDLMDCIADKRVIPVVGKELLYVSVDGDEVLLETWLTKRLAEVLKIDVSQLAKGYGLNEITLKHLEEGGQPRQIYSRLNSIMRKQSLSAPAPLDKLARITDFKLYISLTFDSLMKQAIDQARFHGEGLTQSLIYSTNREFDDLPSEISSLDEPYIYHLFGQLSSAADYAVSDEDYLEFTHHLQSSSYRPQKLFDELREHHLLFIGCGFQNWLERFLVRTVSNNRLLTRPTYGFVADGHARQDASLTIFLKHYQTEVYPSGNAKIFVDELYQRWMEENPVQSPDGGDKQGENKAVRMEPGSVFISYASEDRAAALHIKTALDQAGIDVWFDKSALKPGNDWNREIRANIRHCSFFIPLISRQAAARLEGYFRKEWKWAVSRDEGIDASRNFIRPVIIDDTTESVKGIPEHFWERHASQFTDGIPTQDFVDQLKMELRELRLHEVSLR